jgi:hypothetical protein
LGFIGLLAGDGILKRLARFKSRQLSRHELNFVARVGIAADASITVAGLECAKPDDLHFILRGYCVNDGVYAG